MIKPGILAGGAPPAPVPVSIAPPIITGTPQVGQWLTASTGTWTNSPSSYAYQWQRSLSAGGPYTDIGGATSTTYTLGGADKDYYLVCRVTASNAYGPGAPSLSNELGPVTMPVLLVDTLAIAPARAYALRRVRAVYSGALIRVRRASDNSEIDIGYDSNNDLETAGLLWFCTGTDGFVTTWYDQMGNTALTQSTTSQQPQIVASGALLTLNSRPILRQSTAAQRYLSVALATTTSFALSYSARWIAGGSARILHDTAGGMYFGWQVGQYLRANLGAAQNYDQFNGDTNAHVVSMRSASGTLTNGYRDGVGQTPDNTGAVSAWSGIATNGLGLSADSDFGELYVWVGSSQAADLQLVDASQKARFGI